MNNNGVPISAASMSTLGSTTVKNAIVIVPSGSNAAYVFNVALPFESMLGTNTEVRDFHYVTELDRYVLCGSRGGNAFVAEINSSFTSMEFVPCSDANVFYSILANFPSGITNPLGYYLCGARGNLGVICSITPGTLQFSNFYITNEEWVYHKIITKRTAANSVRIVVSGKSPGNTRLGITVMSTLFTGMSSYMWAQNSSSASHCVVADYNADNTTVILASSYNNLLHLYPINLNSLPVVSEFTFLLGPPNETFYIKDIGVNPFVHTVNPRIAIAGIMTDGLISFQNQAWYAYLTGLTWTVLTNHIYYEPSVGYLFQHYKIRYNAQGNEYTGGYFENYAEKGVLFGSPINFTDICDRKHSVYNPVNILITADLFALSPLINPDRIIYPFHRILNETDFVHPCDVLKGSSSPDLKMQQVEKEGEITTFIDRIIVKDTPMGTNYQIYNVVGQLVQEGTTNSDISTAKLGKGVYILRLENGKTFKFVK